MKSFKRNLKYYLMKGVFGVLSIVIMSSCDSNSGGDDYKEQNELNTYQSGNYNNMNVGSDENTEDKKMLDNQLVNETPSLEEKSEVMNEQEGKQSTVQGNNFDKIVSSLKNKNQRLYANIKESNILVIQEYNDTFNMDRGLITTTKNMDNEMGQFLEHALSNHAIMYYDKKIIDELKFLFLEILNIEIPPNKEVSKEESNVNLKATVKIKNELVMEKETKINFLKAFMLSEIPSLWSLEVYDKGKEDLLEKQEIVMNIKDYDKLESLVNSKGLKKLNSLRIGANNDYEKRQVGVILDNIKNTKKLNDTHADAIKSNVKFINEYINKDLIKDDKISEKMGEFLHMFVLDKKSLNSDERIREKIKYLFSKIFEIYIDYQADKFEVKLKDDLQNTWTKDTTKNFLMAFNKSHLPKLLGSSAHEYSGEYDKTSIEFKTSLEKYKFEKMAYPIEIKVIEKI